MILSGASPNVQELFSILSLRFIYLKPTLTYIWKEFQSLYILKGFFDFMDSLYEQKKVESNFFQMVQNGLHERVTSYHLPHSQPIPT